MTQNALDLVQAIRTASLDVVSWPRLQRLLVLDHLSHLKATHPNQRRVAAIDQDAWCVTVALLRQDHETVGESAQRLVKYLTAHAERWGDTPTLANIRKEYLNQ